MVREEVEEDPRRAHGRREDARIRVLATARKESTMFGGHHWEHPTLNEDHLAGLCRPDLPVLLLDVSAQHALAEWLAHRDVLAPAPPPLATRAWSWLTGLARRLGRAPGTVAVGRAVPAADSPVAQ